MVEASPERPASTVPVKVIRPSTAAVVERGSTISSCLCGPKTQPDINNCVAKTAEDKSRPRLSRLITTPHAKSMA